MSRIFLTSILLNLLACTAKADGGPMKLCTTESCETCPNSITTAGKGYPSCVIYDRDTVLGGTSGEYPPEIGGSRDIYYDIAPQDNPECRTIIRTPASTTDVNCGVPIYGGKGGVCLVGATKKTFMVQFCCGTGDCTAAGVSKRDGTNGGLTFSSAVINTDDGEINAPHSVGDHTGDKFGVFLEDHGINGTALVQKRSATDVPVYKIGYSEKSPVEKRACDKFTKEGDIYTKTGSQSFKVSRYICDETSTITVTNEQSVSRTTSFGASVGDPWGIVSASIEFSIEESASQSSSYQFTPKKGQCGHLSFTPFYNCVQGTITGCEGGDQKGEVCTAKRLSDKQIDGAYTFVQGD